MASLKLEKSDPRNDPTYNQFFEILGDFLQLDSDLTVEKAAHSVEKVLPKENTSISIKTESLSEVLIEIAEKIPYHHPSQLKLARLLAELADSPRIVQTHYDDGSRLQHYQRYQSLAQEVRETLNGPNDENPYHYVNFHAFIANLWENRLLNKTPTIAIWSQRAGLEGWEGRDPDIPSEVYVMAAAQFIIWSGQSLFKHVLYPGDVGAEELQLWNPGPWFSAKHSERSLTLARWHFWRDGYRAIAASPAKGEKQEYSEECGKVAARAAAVMDALEMSMSFG